MSFITLLVLAGQAQASGQGDFCAAVTLCLERRPRSCTEELCAPRAGVDYDDAFCGVFRELDRRGLDAEEAWGRQVYGALAQRYRVTYEVAGTLPLPTAVVTFLTDDVPFAAQLINAYRNTRYSAQYTDRARRQFWGHNGDGMKGTFWTVLQDAQHLQTVYFGYGLTKVLMWELHGVALVFLDLAPAAAGQTAYRFRSMVFPANGFIRSVLEFFMFRRIVTGSIQEIIDNIEYAATAFHRGDLVPIEQYPPLAGAEAQAKLKAFRGVLDAAAQPGCAPRTD